ncbi:MAG: lytic transglycosylase domain-containing protein [Acidobacteriota bacterium]
MTRVAAASLALALAASAAAASSVRIDIRPDGHKVIVNESAAQRAVRYAARLMSVPGNRLAGLIESHASRVGLDPKLVQAVVQVESGYNPRALSNKGAMGLMQLMPDTAQELAVSDPYDVDQNLGGGTRYLRQLLDLFDGKVELALAGYDAGPGAVQRYGGIPPYDETVDYVRSVLGLYRGVDVSAELESAVRRAPVFLARDAKNRILITNARPH